MAQRLYDWLIEVGGSTAAKRPSGPYGHAGTYLGMQNFHEDTSKTKPHEGATNLRLPQRYLLR
jgi:hypothetical protein